MPGARALGVATSEADFDSGTLTGVTITSSTLGTGNTLDSPTLTTPTITTPTITGTGSATLDTLIVASAAAFFSVTAAIAQPSGAAQAAVVTTAATTGTAVYGFTSAQANGMVATVNAIRLALVNLGLIKGS